MLSRLLLSPFKPGVLAGLFVLLAMPVHAQGDLLVVLTPSDSTVLAAGGFVLTRPEEVTIEMRLASGRRGAETAAWILSGGSREVVWRLDPRRHRPDTESQLLSEKVDLPAGAYEVYLDTKSYNRRDEWDLAGIGDLIEEVFDDIFGRGRDRNRETDEPRLRIYAGSGYGERDLKRTAEPFLDRAFVTLTGLGDGQTARQGFSLTEETEIEVYALGEGVGDVLFDYAWIVDAASREPVWKMEAEQTRDAGGHSSNRVVRENVRLPAGDYAVYFVTDEWHAAGEWEKPPPFDPDFWGVTLLLPDEASRRHVYLFDLDAFEEDRRLATITGLGDYAEEWATFTLDQEAEVRIFALGEGGDGEMYDYGGIEDVETGKRVWVMEYDNTVHAGGAEKNRLFSGILRLPAGKYEVYFYTDDNHSFDGWNAPPPFDPPAWGITVYRIEQANQPN